MKKVLFILFCLIFSAQIVFAQDSAPEGKNLKVIILPDNLQVATDNYYIYPKTAEILAVNLANNLKSQHVNVPSVSTLRYDLEKDLRLKLVSKKLMDDFRLTRNVDYVALKKLADRFDVDKAILITSNIDVQNYLLRRTFWDFLNIPGAAVINPAHKLTTHITLIDTTNETVLWTETYEKMLKKIENRIISMDFDTNLEQVEKIKFHYSILTPTIATNVMIKIDPDFEATVNAVITTPKQNQTEEIPEIIPTIKPQIEEDINIKPVVQTKPQIDRLQIDAPTPQKPVVIAPKLRPETYGSYTEPVFSGLKKPPQLQK